MITNPLFDVEVMVEVGGTTYSEVVKGSLVEEKAVRWFYYSGDEIFELEPTYQKSVVATLHGNVTNATKVVWNTTLNREQQSGGAVRFLFDAETELGYCPVSWIDKEKGIQCLEVVQLPTPRMVNMQTGKILFSEEKRLLRALRLFMPVNQN